MYEESYRDKLFMKYMSFVFFFNQRRDYHIGCTCPKGRSGPRYLRLDIQKFKRLKKLVL